MTIPLLNQRVFEQLSGRRPQKRIGTMDSVRVTRATSRKGFPIFKILDSNFAPPLQCWNSAKLGSQF